MNWAQWYFTQMPVRWQNGTGWCQTCSWLDAMELVGLRQGYLQVPQLSMRYVYFKCTNGTWNITIGFYPADELKATGVCREDLCPFPPWKNADTTTQAWTDLVNATAHTPPTVQAEADAPKHKLVDFELVGYTPDDAHKRTISQAAIASGCAIILNWNGRDHTFCAMDCDDGGWFVTDSKSTNASPGYHNWSECSIAAIVKKVSFVDCPLGPPLGPVPPPPIPKATPVLNAAVSLTGGNNPTGLITVSYPGDANNNAVSAQFNPDGTPYVPPVPPPQVLVPPATSATDSTGAVWTIGAAPTTQYGRPILRNGASAAGGQGVLISYKSNQIRVQNAVNDWYLWTGSGWVKSTAP